MDQGRLSIVKAIKSFESHKLLWILQRRAGPGGTGKDSHHVPARSAHRPNFCQWPVCLAVRTPRVGLDVFTTTNTSDFEDWEKQIQQGRAWHQGQGETALPVRWAKQGRLPKTWLKR